MASFVFRFLCVTLLFWPSQSCFQCFVAPQDTLRLCWGHVLIQSNAKNVDACYRKVDRIFNNNEKMMEAARVGGGFDKKLKEILLADIMPMVQEFDQKLNSETVYEQRFQTAADNFIAAASKLPRASGCFPPCGYQSAGAVYNCETCSYDSCEFPLDCPVEEIEVMENSRSRLWCDVPFDLPADIEVIWRFAEGVKTQQLEEFKEVTVGVDRLYSIPSTSSQHQGTYQCEIYTGRLSIVRLYFYITGGQLRPAPEGSPDSILPRLSFLLIACLTCSLLLLFLSLGTLIWSFIPEKEVVIANEEEDSVL
ncbi:sperm acrosome membrane-associated protein 6 isoform X3 [Oryzias melastigma]|uniref:sperm acrosome membrane-associated protein 6 isoform X3 n=1 Tax=Oryzias melastigma TaxID=30732 RepID=UPI000CF831CF|nr:sperm acrosome membrane-associated protein 6 isoform X3 [Oryzias melastigma]